MGYVITNAPLDAKPTIITFKVIILKTIKYNKIIYQVQYYVDSLHAKAIL